MTKETAPEHISVPNLLKSTDQEILDVAEQVCRGQYEVVPCVLPHRLQDQFMAKQHEDLGKCLVRASLQSVMATAQSCLGGGGIQWLTLHPKLVHP